MSQTIELSDESAALLKRQAAAHGMSVEAWVQALAEKARMGDVGGPAEGAGCGGPHPGNPETR